MAMAGQFDTWTFRCAYCGTPLSHTGHLASEHSVQLTCPVCQSLLEVWLLPSRAYPWAYEVNVRVVREGPPLPQPVDPGAALVGGLLGALLAGIGGAIVGAIIGAFFRRRGDEGQQR